MTREVGTQVQRAEYLRGSEPEWFERGNYVASMRWKIQRTFTSIVEADMFFLEHGDNEGTSVPTELVGVVQFISADELNGNQVRYARGKLTITFDPPVGVAVDCNYALEYGRLSKTPLTD